MRNISKKHALLSLVLLQKIVRVSDFRKLHGNGKMVGRHNRKAGGLLHM